MLTSDDSHEVEDELLVGKFSCIRLFWKSELFSTFLTLLLPRHLLLFCLTQYFVLVNNELPKQRDFFLLSFSRFKRSKHFWLSTSFLQPHRSLNMNMYRQTKLHRRASNFIKWNINMDTQFVHCSLCIKEFVFVLIQPQMLKKNCV